MAKQLQSQGAAGMKAINLLAANFDSALRAMELIAPTVGRNNVSISPKLNSEIWIISINDTGVGLVEMLESEEQQA